MTWEKVEKPLLATDNEIPHARACMCGHVEIMKMAVGPESMVNCTGLLPAICKPISDKAMHADTSLAIQGYGQTNFMRLLPL